MEQQDIQQMPMPVISRLDCLDRLLHHLEEKQGNSPSGRYYADLVPAPEADFEKQCKPLSSVLEEIPSKGTLLERVAMLEKRVLQLSQEMEEGEKLNASPKTFMLSVPENILHNSPLQQKGGALEAPNGKQGQGLIQEKASEEKWTNTSPDYKKSHRRRTRPIMRCRKWLGWIQLGC